MILDYLTDQHTRRKYRNVNKYPKQLGCPNEEQSSLDFQLEVPGEKSHNIQSN